LSSSPLKNLSLNTKSPEFVHIHSKKRVEFPYSQKNKNLFFSLIMFLALSSIVTIFLLACNEVVSAHIDYNIDSHHHYHHHYHRHRHHHHHNHHDHHRQKQFRDKSASYQRIITVDQSGNGDFSKIQSAIDSVPSNNKQWIYIKVNEGTYR